MDRDFMHLVGIFLNLDMNLVLLDMVFGDNKDKKRGLVSKRCGSITTSV